MDILWPLATLYRARGELTKAVNVFRKIHKADPAFLRDLSILLVDVHPLLLEAGQHQLGAALFGDAFTFHFVTFDSPHDKPAAGEVKNTMRLDGIVVYVDYLLRMGESEAAVNAIHRGQRWLQGRKDEKDWDARGDDREYAAAADWEGNDDDELGHELDFHLRYRLAVARLRLGQDHLAMASLC